MGKDYKYNIRLNPNKPDHLEAAKILDSLKKRGEKSQLVVDAILVCTGKKHSVRPEPLLLKETIRSVVQDILNEQKQEPSEPPKAVRAEARTVSSSDQTEVDKNLIRQTMQDFGL